MSSNLTYLEVSRGLVKAAHPEETPLVVDPFAGGGSIPLEALRLGCDAFAGDLNPIPILLCRVLLEDVPRFGTDLTDALHDAVLGLTAHLQRELAPLYPAASPLEKPMAYLWARTVNCESPNCGATIPLLRSMWLSRSKKSQWALRIDVRASGERRPDVQLRVHSPNKGDHVESGTIVGGRAICPACSIVLSRENVEAQLKTQHGGTDSARLVAVMVATDKGREFRSPVDRDLDALQRIAEIDSHLHGVKFDDGTPVYPNEGINPVRPSPNARGLSAVTRYGMTTFSDCHLPRQRLALSEVVRFVRKYDPSQSTLAGAVGRCLLIVLGRCVDRWSSCCRLDSTRDTVTGSFSKQALQMVWDFCEANPFSEWSGGLDNATNWVAKALEQARVSLPRSAQVHLGDARAVPLPDQSAQTWFTDPPYYDSVPYADLADFFFCWLRRANPNDPSFRDVFDESNVLTPKEQECVWNQSYASDGKRKDSVFFEHCVSVAFREGRRSLEPGGVGCVVFAHKSTEGWEALLSGMIRAGLSIRSSWPIQTEMKARTAARDAASLMGSVHLVCRPRPDDAPVGDWADVLRELPKRVGDWMERLQGEGVRGADLVFACIGPALEIFSQYGRVETAEGREVKLPEYLEKVWEVVGRTALRQVLGTDALGDFGEDARLTALFLWTLYTTNGQNGSQDQKQTRPEEKVDDNDPILDEEEERKTRQLGKSRSYVLPYDIVRRIAQPLGIRLDQWTGRLIEIEKGIVGLLPLAERAALLVEPGVAHDLTLIDSVRRAKSTAQLPLFEDPADVEREQKGATARSRIERETWSQLHLDTITTLEHVHKAMLLQKQGHTNALRELLLYEKHYRPEFVRLANALSALYPRKSEEKRLLDAMLLAVPR